MRKEVVGAEIRTYQMTTLWGPLPDADKYTGVGFDVRQNFLGAMWHKVNMRISRL
jgi:hypothetical protein